MSLVNLRAPFIFYCDLINHQDIKDKYYERILRLFEENKHSNVGGWNCKVKTTFNSVVDFLWDDYFQNSVIWNPLDQMLEKVDLYQYPVRSFVREIWTNLYKYGEFQEVHDHVGNARNIFSGIYIIDQKGDNKTSFIHNNYGILDNQVHTKDMDDIKEGTVIIFPSNLLHYVNPVEDDRCTISFNIRCDF